MDKDNKGYIFCPSCDYKQHAMNTECVACGLVFSKHLKYVPVKTLINKFLSPKEIMEIRRAEDKFNKVQHDQTSKAELIIHCQKENILDLASYHTRNSNDKNGMELIKKLSSIFYIGTQKAPKIWTPSFILFTTVLGLIVALTLLLRTYV
jgi:hypothetical protein